MPNSFAETAELTCPQCHQPFTADVWLIVDAAERPDLLERARAGMLHDLRCPHCGNEGSIDAPTLIFRPTQTPPLIFLPGDGDSAAQNQAQVNGLLDRLRQTVGSGWQAAWVAESDTLQWEGVEPNADTSPDQNELIEIIDQFIDADSWDVSKHIVETHPELLSDGADALLTQLAAIQEDDGARHMVEEYRTLLRRCREVGIDQAFAEQEGRATSAGAPSPSPALQAILQELSQPARISDMPRRVQLCEAALTQLDRAQNPALWAALQVTLGNSLAQNPQGPRAENLERAIAGYEQALQVRTRQAMPIEWATTTMNLAAAYYARIRGERAENLERAIELNEQALQVMTRQAMPIDWATTTMNLALAYSNRIRGERAENLERAIAGYEQALQVMTRQAMPIDWATTTMNLATAYSNRIRGERAENLERAIAGYEQALQVMTRQAMPVDWAQTTSNLASTYLDRIRGERAENLERAIELNEHALAHVYRLETFPDDHRRVQNRLGDLYFQQGAWAAAASAFAAVLQAGENLYQTAATPEARQGELGKWQGVPVQLAYALLKSALLDAAAYPEATLTLERNRARWLSESLAVRTAKPIGVPDTLWQRFVALGQQIQIFQAESRLPEATPAKRPYLVLTDLLRTAYAQLAETIAQMRTHAPDFMPQPSFADIQAAARIAPLVYLLTTDAGGLALIVQTDKVTPVWLDGFTEGKLRKNLIEWFDAYEQQRTARQTWLDTMARITRALWDEVMGPVAAALYQLTSPSPSLERGLGGEVVTLIPTGLLSLLPLHAAWTDNVTGASEMPLTSRRYFLDEYMVAYAPSSAALRHAQVRAQTAMAGRLLAIDEPRPVQGNALPNSAREVAAVADHFSQPQILAHLTATRQAALAALAGDVFTGGVDVAHFSCHGGNDWQNPLESGLMMAHNEMLTVRDLLELQLPGARLATLSACETGIVGTNLPDEVVALPSALVQAGFAGVVASLWSVADISTAMLMARFYDFWQDDKWEPAQALHAAQQWVRDTTNREKRAYFLDKQPAFFRALENLPQARREFEHPFWWAAFYLTGV